MTRPYVEGTGAMLAYRDTLSMELLEGGFDALAGVGGRIEVGQSQSSRLARGEFLEVHGVFRETPTELAI